MSEPKQWIWGYHKNQLDDMPTHFPNRDQVWVLKDIFHERAGSHQRFIAWAGIHYVLVVEPNVHCRDCLENTLLENIYKAFEEKSRDGWRDRISSVLKNCMEDFWPYLEKDYSERRAKGTLMQPIGVLDFDRTELHKLELKTIDSTVHAIASETEDSGGFRPVENKFPGVACFAVSDIEVVERITMAVFRIKIHGQEYCLKAGDKRFLGSVEKLQRAPKIANVLCITGVAVNKDGKVVGMVTPFISGNTLHRLPSATASQKITWKEQISTAVKSLHDNGIVWGDAKPDNILISSANSEAVLIDLDGGRTEDWVDEELYQTQEGDLQALERILRFIDKKCTREDVTPS